MRWDLTSTDAVETLDELRTVLLKNRQITDQSAFFAPLTPFDISLEDVGIDSDQMKKAVERIHQARDQKNDVLIFGDYDADGVCATAILWEALKEVGIVARPFIPHREEHGYGLNARSLKAVLSGSKPDLLITVDNGIVAHAAFLELKAAGIDTILTDHHQPEVSVSEKTEPIYPEALSVVHSTKLCGSTVAWFLARELSLSAARHSLDLAAIATVADQMTLLGPNRSFVYHGLHSLAGTKRVGLKQLMAKTQIDPQQLDVNSIHYGIAPRINAMGRLKHSIDALRLVCTTSIKRAQELVEELHDTNATRQELTAEMIDHALESSLLWKDEHIIIVASSEYHEGVIGLIAGKLTEKFYKPAIAIAMGSEVAKASARSIPGVNIIELIRLVKDELLEAGGHPMAAGFGLKVSKLESVTKRLQRLARDQISLEMLEPSLALECQLPISLVTLETCKMLTAFAPFGNGNREPVFSFQDLQVVSAQTMGRENKHLRLSLKPSTQRSTASVQSVSHTASYSKPAPGISAVGWGIGEKASELRPHQKVDVAGKLSINSWKGKENVQLVVRDVCVSQ